MNTTTIGAIAFDFTHFTAIMIVATFAMVLAWNIASIYRHCFMLPPDYHKVWYGYPLAFLTALTSTATAIIVVIRVITLA